MSSEPVPKAIIFCHEPSGQACRVEERLTQRGFDVHSHLVTADPDKPNEAKPFPSLEAYDVLVVMGSIRSLTRKHEIDSWIHDEMKLVRAAHESDLPVLGVCFGGQLLAETLGGAVEVSPAPELGWLEIDSIDGEDNPVGAGPWMEWHDDRFAPPPGATVLAQTESAVQLFRIGKSVGTQFHPEVDLAHIANFVEGTTDAHLAEYDTDRETVLADAAFHEAANIKQCHALVDWFLDKVAFGQ
ncbi:MAG: type 1 glutamine amidotransferase [Acidimicrobiales bacterium]